MRIVRRLEIQSLIIVIAAMLMLFYASGCATATFVAADQTRKDAVQAPIAAYVAAHPEQAQTWADFNAAWQKDLDANQGGFKPWWSTSK